MTINDPNNLEVFVAKLVHFILHPYYKRYAKKLEIKSTDKVIDFGSGPGAMSKFIVKYLDEEQGVLDCVDISERWIKICKKRLRRYENVGFFQGMITKLNVKDDFYDKILIHFVLHDINQNIRQKVVTELGKKLTTNGKLIIREPTSRTHGIEEKEIEEIMNKAGLKKQASKLAKRRFVGTVYDGLFYK